MKLPSLFSLAVIFSGVAAAFGQVIPNPPVVVVTSSPPTCTSVVTLGNLLPVTTASETPVSYPPFTFTEGIHLQLVLDTGTLRHPRVTPAAGRRHALPSRRTTTIAKR